jgi:hypothetical protein
VEAMALAQLTTVTIRISLELVTLKADKKWREELAQHCSAQPFLIVTAREPR